MCPSVWSRTDVMKVVPPEYRSFMEYVDVTVVEVDPAQELDSNSSRIQILHYSGLYGQESFET